LTSSEENSTIRFPRLGCYYDNLTDNYSFFFSDCSVLFWVMQLNAEIAEYNDARERELPLVQDVDGKVKELRQRIGDLNNHQMSRRATYRKLKEMSTEMDGEVSKDVECWFFVDSANNLETDML